MGGTIFRAVRAVSLLALAACATKRIASTPSGLAERIPFLRPGETQMEEALGRLGEPAFRHDAEHVLIWAGGEDGDGRLRVVDPRRQRAFRVKGEERSGIDATWSRWILDLVLQFDASGTYVRGSLVHAE